MGIEIGNGIYGHFITLCFDHSFLFTLFPCSRVGPFPGERVLHELFLYGPFTQAADLQEQTAPVWIPTGSQVLPENLLQYGLLSTGCSPCQAQALPRLHPPGISTYPGIGLPMGCSVCTLSCRNAGMCFPTGCKESLVWHLEYFLPLLH